MKKIAQLNPLQPYGRDRCAYAIGSYLCKPFSKLGALYRRKGGRSGRLIAVTGSFGKTTTTRAILAALRLAEHPMQTRSVNAFAWLSYLMWRQLRRGDTAVLEVGIGQPGQMRGYAETLRPDIVIVTGIGAAHISYFPDGITGIRREKAELVAALPRDGVAVLNGDDEHALWMKTQTQACVLTYGFDPAADITATDVQLDWPQGTLFHVRLDGRTYAVRTRFFGAAGVYAALAAIAVARAVGREIEDVIAALAELAPTPNRLEPHPLPSGAIALLDDTKGTLDTVLHAMAFLKDVPAQRRLAVLGHLPLGTLQPETQYHQMGLAAGKVLDRAYLMHRIDAHYEAYRRGLMEAGMEAGSIVRATSIRDAADRLRKELQSGDVLLAKAHFCDRLSRIILLLQGVDVRCRAQFCPRFSGVPCTQCSLMRRDFDPPLAPHHWNPAAGVNT